MRYVGGKARIASWVVEHLLNVEGTRTKYLEPFVGSGAVLAKIAPHFSQVEAGDACEDLILLWQAIQQGWDPPRTVTRHAYAELRYASPSAWRGLVGFGASFGGKWFGGYVDTCWDTHHQRETKPYLNAAVESLLKVRGAVSHVRFVPADYRTWSPDANTVVYCDPPYQGTLGYGADFNSEEFWNVAEGWARGGAAVVVSESQAPGGWVPLAERTRKAMLRVAVGKENAVRREVLWVLNDTTPTRTEL